MLNGINNLFPFLLEHSSFLGWNLYDLFKQNNIIPGLTELTDKNFATKANFIAYFSPEKAYDSLFYQTLRNEGFTLLKLMEESQNQENEVLFVHLQYIISNGLWVLFVHGNEMTETIQFHIQTILNVKIDENRYMDPDFSRHGATPLNTAVYKGIYKTIKMLLENGANIYLVNRYGEIPQQMLESNYGINKNKSDTLVALKYFRVSRQVDDFLSILENLPFDSHSKSIMEFLFDKSANSDFDLILFAFNQLVSLIRQKRSLRPKEREEFSFISTMLSNLCEENLYRNQDYYRKKIHEDSRLQINEEVIHISTPPGPLIAKLIANP